MAQTTYYVIHKTTDGHRLIQQMGANDFTSSNASVTMSVGFRKLVGGHVTPTQAPAGSLTAKVAGYIPYIATDQITQHANRKVVVDRATGSISALSFAYTFYGY